MTVVSTQTTNLIVLSYTKKKHSQGWTAGLRRVDLPQPTGPITITRWPRGTTACRHETSIIKGKLKRIQKIIFLI